MALNLRRCLFGIVLLLIFGLGSCTGDNTGDANPQQGLEPVETPEVAVNEANPAAGLPVLEGEAVVEMIINGQPVTMAINGNAAPVTAGNFVDLVNRGVYDGLMFHRVVREPQPFVAQGGDPQSADPQVPVQQLGTGSFVDPETQQPRYIPLEIQPEGGEEPVYSQTFDSAGISAPPQLSHQRGAIAMARSQLPDSASSQFYITLADLPFLDGSYAVFGNVTDGMDVVDQIQQGDRIESARVVEGLDNLKTGG